MTAQPTPAASISDLDFAVDVVRRAGEFTLTHFRAAELEIIRKADGSPVTAADQGAEHLMRQLIGARYPEDGILGEEEGETHGTSGRRWVIDPIDGTEAFTHGVALYSNLLYLEDEHGPAIGVINVPAIDEMVWAGRGLGCFLNGIPCSVSERTTLPGSVLSTSGFDYWDTTMLQATRESGMQMRTWGDGYGYLLVASGRIEAMVDPTINFWDIAPCLVIIPEAGGTLSRADGATDVELTSCVATNGVLHDQVIAALNAS
ncbi:MAG: inositol monophosphatase family protein [Acidimicrobiales bacterium]